MSKKEKWKIAAIIAIFVVFSIIFGKESLAANFIVRNVSNTNQIYFIVNGTTGYVGIGTGVPNYPLHVVGDVYWTGTLQGGNVPWARLINFPSTCSCPSGYAVQTIGSDCTCIPINATQGVINGSGIVNYIPVFTGVSTIGASPFYLTSNNLNLGQQSLINASWINASYLNVSAGFVVLPNGNVGIGTSSPSQRLTVAGNIGIQAGANAFIGTLDNYALSLRTNNADRIFITNTGNVGIGTTNPGEKLELASGGNIKLNIFPADDTTQGLVSIRFDSRDTGGSTHTWRMYTAPIAGGWGVAPNSIEFWEYPPGGGSLRRFVILKNTTASPSVVAIDGAGNVGIGTTSPSYKLTVSGGDIYGSNNLYIAGNVGIGTTSPVKKLDVVGDINATGAVYSVSGYYIGTNQIITSARVLQNIASISQSLLPTTDNSYDLGSSSNRWRDAYFSGTIYGNIQGTITPTGNINMQGYSIYNAYDVNATRFFQGSNRVIDTVIAGNGLTGGGSGPTVSLSVNNGTGLAIDGSGKLYVIFGSSAGTAAEGNKQITISAGTGLSGGGTVTIGAGGSVSLGINPAMIPRKDVADTINAPWTFAENVWFNKNVFIAGNLSYVNVQTLNVNGSMIPIFDNQFNLGNSSNRWANVYAVNVYASNINGGSPITGSGSVGQVAFFTASNTITGSDNLYWDNTNARLGIGTKLPQQRL
ncbi:MAG: hypothetical protein NDF52_06400, partial [archaeon YNP-WB-062]|nr:hypothetical protein [Candidatus Culexarchaeum yellowstonense]